LEEFGDSYMHGVKRVLNVKQLVKFPYPATMLQSTYRQNYGQKSKLRVRPFNLEKEKMYGRLNTSASNGNSLYVSTTRSAFQDPLNSPFVSSLPARKENTPKDKRLAFPFP
jgi:hypothetical protein